MANLPPELSPPERRGGHCQGARPLSQTNQQQYSTPVSASALENLLGGDASLCGALSLAHLLQPGIYRRARGQPLELSAQEFLHRLTLQSRSRDF